MSSTPTDHDAALVLQLLDALARFDRTLSQADLSGATLLDVRRLLGLVREAEGALDRLVEHVPLPSP